VHKIVSFGTKRLSRVHFMVKTIARFFLFALVASLWACASGSEYKDEPTYSSGYSEGCASASRTGSRVVPSKITRDNELYKSDKAYRAGWNAGYHACGRSLEDDPIGGGPY